MSRQSLNKGRIGEQKAAIFLQKKGYRILARNFRKKYGEIDIIALEPQESALVFLEVKTRYSYEYGYPEEAVNSRKIKNLTQTAEYYKMLHPELPKLMRIDVISVEIDSKGKVRSLKHIKNITQ